MIDCRIVNGVRCVPPKNRPSGTEIRTCRQFLVAEIGAMSRLEVIVALGRIAHDTVLAAVGKRPGRPTGSGTALFTPSTTKGGWRTATTVRDTTPIPGA